MSNKPTVHRDGPRRTYRAQQILTAEKWDRIEDPRVRGIVLSNERTTTQTFFARVPGFKDAPDMTVRWTCSNGDPLRGVDLEIPQASGPDHRRAWLGFGYYLGKWLVSATIPTDQELETGLPEFYDRLMGCDAYPFIGYTSIVANSMHREASPDPKTAKVWADRFTIKDKAQHGIAYYGEAGFDPRLAIEAMEEVRSTLRSWVSEHKDA